MNELGFFAKLRRLKTDLAAMSYKDKLIHIWTYYKWIIPVMLVIIILFSVVITGITNKSNVKVIGGIAVNVNLSDEGERYLKEDYKEYLGLKSKKQQVVFTETIIQNTTDATDYMSNYYAMMSVIALCSNQEVDYMILNDTGVSIMAEQGAFMDLRNIFTQDELNTMQDLITYVEDEETKEKIPALLNITDTPFMKAHITKSQNVFFGFITNSPRLEEAKALYEYLLAWKAE